MIVAAASKSLCVILRPEVAGTNGFSIARSLYIQKYGYGTTHGINSLLVSFEWDESKDAENRRKHGVSFADAQRAFFDPGRVIARDLSHSDIEDRYYCFGRVDGGVLTVRFTWRGSTIRIIGAGYWRRGRRVYEENTPIQR